jgi:hypothetical protein
MKLLLQKRQIWTKQKQKKLILSLKEPNWQKMSRKLRVQILAKGKRLRKAKKQSQKKTLVFQLMRLLKK